MGEGMDRVVREVNFRWRNILLRLVDLFCSEGQELLRKNLLVKPFFEHRAGCLICRGAGFLAELSFLLETFGGRVSVKKVNFIGDSFVRIHLSGLEKLNGAVRFGQWLGRIQAGAGHVQE